MCRVLELLIEIVVVVWWQHPGGGRARLRSKKIFDLFQIKWAICVLQEEKHTHTGIFGGYKIVEQFNTTRVYKEGFELTPSPMSYI